MAKAMSEKEDIKQDKAIVKKAFKMHDKQEHKGGKGTDLSKLKKGGKVKKMAKGGPTGMEMRSMGRNLARARNQKPGSK
jgi:hypothetical protein